jgi:oxygen-independent coproporphyrinogen-3 oxidase
MAGLILHIPRLSHPAAERVARSARGTVSRLVQAMTLELAYYGESHAKNETIETLYIAGHPADLLDDELAAIVEAVVAHFDTASLVETTLEVSPGALDTDLLRTYTSLGIGRLHLQVGSFFGNGDETRVVEGLERVRDAGFAPLSVGLAFGAADQPEEYWMGNVQRTLTLDLPHLVFEPALAADDVFDPWVRNYGLPEAGAAWTYRYDAASRYLTDNGYVPYLLGSFAREEAESRHHLLIAEHGHVLGIGPAAQSFWWHGTSYSRAHRWENVAQPRRYTELLHQRQLPVEARRLVDMDTLADEFLTFQLGTREGVNLQRLETQYGVDLLTERLDVLAALEAAGWIEPIRNQRLRLTLQGRAHWHDLISSLLA